jgi:hypothetical protein
MMLHLLLFPLTATCPPSPTCVCSTVCQRPVSSPYLLLRSSNIKIHLSKFFTFRTYWRNTGYTQDIRTPAVQCTADILRTHMIIPAVYYTVYCRYPQDSNAPAVQCTVDTLRIQMHRLYSVLRISSGNAYTGCTMYCRFTQETSIYRLYIVRCAVDTLRT